ncbi:MAG: hypothetical protein K5643_09170 [Saccharofermentans sp.]|nr:hypothetical protein [Saccharofermentans sp.]
MDQIKVLFLIAVIGHLICGVCDCLITYVPGGRKLDVTKMSDNKVLSDTFANMPLRNPLISMIAGCFALFMVGCGYYGLYLWMSAFSKTYALIILIADALLLSFGVAHHVFCGVGEWFYVRMGRTEDARQAVVKFMKDTSLSMIFCYIGLITMGVVLFIAVVSGITSLPQWACIINFIPVAVILFLTRIGGASNWSGALMFLGLMILI